MTTGRPQLNSFKLKLVAYFVPLSLAPLAAIYWGFSTVAGSGMSRQVKLRRAAGLRAERLRVALAARSIPGARGLRVTASFGVAEYAPGSDAEQLVAAADQALYRARHTGKDRVERAVSAAF